MKKILLILCFLVISPAYAGLYDDILGSDKGNTLPPPVDIDYGYNAIGDFVPTSVDNQRIQYGYNAVGDYVPMSVGGRQINYGYNAVGDYVPISY